MARSFIGPARRLSEGKAPSGGSPPAEKQEPRRTLWERWHGGATTRNQRVPPPARHRSPKRMCGQRRDDGIFAGGAALSKEIRLAKRASPRGSEPRAWQRRGAAPRRPEVGAAPGPPRPVSSVCPPLTTAVRGRQRKSPRRRWGTPPGAVLIVRAVRGMAGHVTGHVAPASVGTAGSAAIDPPRRVRGECAARTQRRRPRASARGARLVLGRQQFPAGHQERRVRVRRVVRPERGDDADGLLDVVDHAIGPPAARHGLPTGRQRPAPKSSRASRASSRPAGGEGVRRDMRGACRGPAGRASSNGLVSALGEAHYRTTV
jgi:hypothetical protein